MKNLPTWIVSRRTWLLSLMAALAAVCAVLALQVRVNYDMTKYLPDDSAMKQGMDLMGEVFPSMGADKSIRVMAEGLSPEEQAELLAKLKAIPYVESVAHDDSSRYQRDGRSLFVLSTAYDYGSAEERSIERALDGEDIRAYHTVFRNDNPGADGVPAWLLLAGVSILVVILLVMCRSWFEPLLFLVNIGIAVVINEGTNLFLGSVSYVTSTMASVLQLVLSIDYSIMLANRYRQEKAAGLGKAEAAAAALRNCFSSVAGSALTTAAGLLALAFMHFKIGLDLGIVLAKGVLISLFCVLTVLPGLLVLGDRMIARTEKKIPTLSFRRLAGFSYRRRFLLSGVFAVFLVVFFLLQGNTQISYTLTKVDPIMDYFPPENTLVLVYENQDEEKIADLEKTLAQQEETIQVMGYPSVFGQARTAQEMAEAFGSLGAGMGFDTAGFSFDPSMLSMVYSMAFAGSSLPPEEQKMTIPELINYVHDSVLENPLFAALVTPEIREAVAGAKQQVEDGVRMLKSDRWSRMILWTSLPVESEKTDRLMDLLEDTGRDLSGEYYLIGYSAMSREMQRSFAAELRNITLLTAAAIFLIVLLTSRSFVVPALLVLIVQCGVWITVTVVGWQGYSIYFLALLIVECILMGATIDYGILFTGYYRERRKRLSSPEALEAAYDGSVHSILTSGLILVLVTGILGYTYSDPTVAEICRTIATGALSAMLLILFLLPGLLAAFDRRLS